MDLDFVKYFFNLYLDFFFFRNYLDSILFGMLLFQFFFFFFGSSFSFTKVCKYKILNESFLFTMTNYAIFVIYILKHEIL